MKTKALQLSAGKLLEEQLARSLGLDHYSMIMDKAKASDVSRDREFQRAFNAFYRIRRNAEWRNSYYYLFEEAKTENLSFKNVITSLFTETGNVEASFSSKMIATIHPEKPIWDQYVLQNLGLKLKGEMPRDRVNNAIEIYRQIEGWYADYLQTEEAGRNIEEFDRLLPSYAWITDVKKIDYLLWSKRN